MSRRDNRSNSPRDRFSDKYDFRADNLVAQGVGALLSSLAFGLITLTTLAYNRTYTAPADKDSMCTNASVDNTLVAIALLGAGYIATNLSAHIGKAQFNPLSTIVIGLHQQLAGVEFWDNMWATFANLAGMTAGWFAAGGILVLLNDQDAPGNNTGLGMPCFGADFETQQKFGTATLYIATGAFIITLADCWNAMALQTGTEADPDTSSDDDYGMASTLDDGEYRFSAKFMRAALISGFAYAGTFAMFARVVSGGYNYYSWIVPYALEGSLQPKAAGRFATGGAIGAAVAGIAAFFINWYLYDEWILGGSPRDDIRKRRMRTGTKGSHSSRSASKNKSK